MKPAEQGAGDLLFVEGTGEFRRTILLFLTTVVLPVFIAAGAFLGSFRERAEQQRVANLERLKLRADQIGKTLTPDFAMTWICNVALWHAQQRQDVPDLTPMIRFLRGIEKVAPGAFRWLIWDGAGKPISLPSEIALPGSRIWRSIAADFLIPQRETIRTFHHGGPLDQRLEPFLSLIGQRSDLVNFFIQDGKFHPLKWGGKPARPFG